MALLLSGIALLDWRAASAQTFSPTFSTTPGGTVTLGTGIKLTDTASLAGGLNPTGTIGFTLFNPSDFAVDAETVAVNGNGTYSTPTGYLPTQAGTYRWVGTYSGDANNTGSTVGGESEAQLVVATPEPAAFTIVAFALGGLIAARSCRGRNGRVAM